MPPNGAESCPRDRSLMYVPRVITTIDTGYQCGLCGVKCLSDTEVWTCSNNNMMKRFNRRGERVKSIQTKSGNKPDDIAVSGDLHVVYTHYRDRTVNIVKNAQIQTVIRLRGEYGDGEFAVSVVPPQVTFSLLWSVMITNKQKLCVTLAPQRNKVFNTMTKDNLSIHLVSTLNTSVRTGTRSVSDNGTHAVVVVNQAGKLRFTYTGPPSITKGSFNPQGITTDSQGRILIDDFGNDRIPILDQDGQFFCYIFNCYLHSPRDLSLDTRDNLFVAEFAGKVKKIKYYM